MFVHCVLTVNLNMLSKPLLSVWLLLVVASSVIGNTDEDHGVNHAITKRRKLNILMILCA